MIEGVFKPKAYLLASSAKNYNAVRERMVGVKELLYT
jgi:hypothetical protein